MPPVYRRLLYVRATRIALCVVVRVRDRGDFTRVLDGLPAQVARLVVRGAERRLVYEAGAWQIDP